jgi:hypothetical protein
MSADPEAFHSFANKELGALNSNEQAYCDLWFNHLGEQLPNWLHPGRIDFRTEPLFARENRRIVASTVEVNLDRSHGQTLLSGLQVMDNLAHYYQAFPTNAVNSAQQRVHRVAFQDERIRLANQWRYRYPEINVVIALRRAYRERHLRAETRAMYALLTAYGSTIKLNPPTRADFYDEL